MYFNLYHCLVVATLLPVVAYGETTSYTCKFSVEATSKGLSKQASPFELRFIVDASTRKSYLIGNLGASEVKEIPNTDGGVSFLEITASGNIMVTAITNSGEAVHSRNGIMFETLVPSQLYGHCTRQ